MEQYNVGVVGAGYVGLVTGVCLAHIGHHVTLIDVNEDRVSDLERGEIPIYEPGLEALMARCTDRLRFTTQAAPVIRSADLIFIAVDTPQGGDGAADLSNVGMVARGIGQALAEAPPGSRTSPLVVVNKSTVPVGSGDYVSMLIQEGAEDAGLDPADSHVDFRVVSNPEFLREGSAVRDSLFPNRIVVGASSRDALDTMRALYEPIIEQSFSTNLDPRPQAAVAFVTTDLVSAEMVKYAANAFLATKISFINEVANLCELVGADVKSVAHGIGLDERIGPRFLDAGVGWGGSCFPKDVAALRAVAREYGYDAALLDATTTVNQAQRQRVITKLQQNFHTLQGKRIALLGLAFKPNTDDLRDAPSLEIARMLVARGARVVGYDPVVGKEATRAVPAMRVTQDPYEALRGVHAAVVVTEWEDVRSLDLARAAELMLKPPLLVDGRNTFDPREVRAAGIRYQSFGRV